MQPSASCHWLVVPEKGKLAPAHGQSLDQYSYPLRLIQHPMILRRAAAIEHFHRTRYGAGIREATCWRVTSWVGLVESNSMTRVIATMVIFGWRRRPSTLISSSMSILPQLPLPLLFHPVQPHSPADDLPSDALNNRSSGR
jgi:hypothetical protein